MWSTTETEKRELCRAITTRRAPRVLEIGAFKGETTRALADAASQSDGYVVVIDPMRWAAEIVANGIARHLPAAFSRLAIAAEQLLGGASYEKAFWENVGPFRRHVRLHRAVSTSPKLLASDAHELRSFDVVFIDGDHSYEGARADLWHWGLRTAVGGTILVHDASERFPGVLAALKEFAAAHDVVVDPPLEGSLAVIHVTAPFAPEAARAARVTTAIRGPAAPAEGASLTSRRA